MTKTPTQIFLPWQIRTKHREDDNPNFFLYITLPLSDLFLTPKHRELPLRLKIRLTDNHKQT